MSTICREFEKEEAEEGEESQRQERILQLMQQVNWLFCCEVKFCTQFHSISYANLNSKNHKTKLNMFLYYLQLQDCGQPPDDLGGGPIPSPLLSPGVLQSPNEQCRLMWTRVLIKIWLQFFTLRDNIIICCVNLKSASYNVFTACVVQLESTCCVKISVVHVCTFHGKMVKSRHIRTSCFGMII